MHALPGHEAQPHAPPGLAQPSDVRDGSDHDHAAVSGTDHVADRSIYGGPFLRRAGWWVGRAVDALLLDIRPSRSLRADYSLLRFHVGDHSGVFPETDFR